MKVVLNDVVERITGNEDRFNTSLEYYVGGEHYESTRIAIYDKGLLNSEKGQTLGFKFHFPFKKGDVLFMARNPHLRKAGMVMFDGICSDASYILRTKDHAILLQEYLPLVLQSDEFWAFFEANKSGSVNYLMNWKELKNYEFELPSIEDQKEKSELVWAIEETRRAYEKLLYRIDDLIKSQFIEMFGDPVTNPLGWKKEVLSSIVTSDCNISYGIVQTGPEQDEGIPVFRPVDIVGHYPKIDELKKTTRQISDKYKRTLLKGRELLITVRANIADTCIVGKEFEGCNVGRGIVPIRTEEEKIRLEFLKAQIDYDSMNKYIKSLARGITLIQLNMDDLRKIEFIVPPVELQDRYILLNEQSDKSKFEIKTCMETAEKVLQRIINENR